MAVAEILANDFTDVMDFSEPNLHLGEPEQWAEFMRRLAKLNATMESQINKAA